MLIVGNHHLLADAEVGKDIVEDNVGGDFAAGDLAYEGDRVSKI